MNLSDFTAREDKTKMKPPRCLSPERLRYVKHIDKPTNPQTKAPLVLFTEAIKIKVKIFVSVCLVYHGVSPKINNYVLNFMNAVKT